MTSSNVEGKNTLWSDKIDAIFEKGIVASNKASNLTVNLAYVLYRAAVAEEIVDGKQFIVYAKGVDQTAAREIIASLCEEHSKRYTDAEAIYTNKNLSKEVRDDAGNVMRAAKTIMREATKIAALLLVDRADGWNLIYDLGRKGNARVKVPANVDITVTYHDRSGRVVISGYETIDGELSPSETFGTRSFIGADLRRLAAKMFKKATAPTTTDAKADTSDVKVSALDLEKSCLRVTLEADKAFKDISKANVTHLQDVLLHLVALFGGADNVVKIAEHEAARNGTHKVEHADKQDAKVKASKAKATAVAA